MCKSVLDDSSPASIFAPNKPVKPVSRPLPWFPRLLLSLLAALLLSGCVDYNLGLQFDSPNQGQFTQRIQVGEQLQRFSGATLQQWLKEIEKRSQQLGGRVDRLSEQTLQVTIPFASAAELETKFNRFFSPDTPEKKPAAPDELPPIASQIHFSHSNLLLLERTHLVYDLDLRALGITSSSGNLLLSPSKLVTLEFRLDTPWGARNLVNRSTGVEARKVGRSLVWQLTPGAANHIEAVFWLPSPLGLGTLGIVLLVAAGWYLKYPPRPQPPSGSPSSPVI